MSDETNQDALKALYQMAMDGEELTGIIYEPEESDSIVFVFKKHIVTIDGKVDFVISDRSAKAGYQDTVKLFELRPT